MRMIMLIGALWEEIPNALYRARDPLSAMARRGHQLTGQDAAGRVDPRALRACDVVYVYRRNDPQTFALLRALSRAGVPIVYDNDDAMAAVPREAANYKKVGGLRGQALLTACLKVAGLARVVTTTTEHLARLYASAGAPVRVIPNALDPGVPRPTRKHDGLVIGWVAGAEHAADVGPFRLGDVLEQVLSVHPEVSVETVGVKLDVRDRYRHDAFVDFNDLPGRIGGFDIGIAPLADIPLNRGRSDIKLKEYAVSGVPWLASPVGQYQGLGEREGGRLVVDGDWSVALDALIRRKRDRKRLSRNGRKWARTQTIDATADAWERVFVEAAG
jgi:glycosyltransferase involved in cell wall biosynthesis